MGILTDPTLMQKSKFTKNLVKHTRKICIILYIAGFTWFGFLANTDFNHATYLSENALSPGLVYSEIKQESGKYAQSLMEELVRERENHKTSIPYSWLMAKMRQIGLETHTHNFTIHYPFGSKKSYSGKNVYGILRAPRIGSTEGIIFSTPYRPPNSAHTEITASIPILLAFADFARKKNYWAKDIIFLVTDHEQLGIHAWLEAYFNDDVSEISKGILDAGSLTARAGALQAAINLEIQDFDTQYIDVKIEGLNGQLPNLDLFNLIQRLTVRESLISGYKQTRRKKKSIHQQKTTDNIKHLLNMIFTQANGVPTGNHGLFHRFRVEALTLEAVKRESSNSNNKIIGALSLLKTIEGISRSLNNLLERFHQSFFFYILVANDRFVSIGDFIPSLILMSGSLYIKAFLIWMGMDKGNKKSSETSSLCSTSTIIQFQNVVIIFAFTIIVGISALYLPQLKQINELFSSYNMKTETANTVILVVIALMGMIVPVFINLSSNGLELLHIASLLYLGSALTVLGLLNFALGFLISIITVPLAIFVNINYSGTKRLFSTFYTFMLHPLVVIYAVVSGLTLISFKELNITEVFIRAVFATMDALTFSICDWMIYGNWLFVVITLVFYPAWLLFWIINVKQIKESKMKED